MVKVYAAVGECQGLVNETLRSQRVITVVFKSLRYIGFTAVFQVF